MKRSLKREVDDMGDLESPGDHRSPKQAVGIQSFPEADWVLGVRRGWSTPSSGKKRGRPTGARSPDIASTIRTGVGSSLQTRWSLNSTAMVAGSSICKFLMP